jgi:hypothetical protein
MNEITVGIDLAKHYLRCTQWHMMVAWYSGAQ